MSQKNLPGTAQYIADHHPEVWDAYEQLGKAVANAGPLDARMVHLVKIASAIAQRSEGATHSHVRRAREAGVSKDEIRHVSILLTPTIGFPQAMAGRTWIEDVLTKEA